MTQQPPVSTMEFLYEYPDLKNYDKMKYKSHLVKKENHIVTLAFNRPHIRNANEDMWEVLRILDCVKADNDARLIVVTGVGDAFHAGANIKGWSASQESDRKIYERNRVESAGLGKGSTPMMRYLHDLHKPSIAMVNGAARGMGADWALACDLVVASDRATFGWAYIIQGLCPPDGALWYLTHRCGYGVAMDLALTARVVDAEEALRLRIVDRVVAHSQLEKTTYELADLIANKRSPMAVRLARHLIYQATNQTLLDNLDASQTAMAWTAASPYSREAMKAWVEKRQPNFEKIWE